MKKPLILVDGHVLDGPPQGTSTHIIGLYGGVARRGAAEVLIAAEREDSVARVFPDCDGVKWVPLDTANKYRRLAVGFDRLADRHRPDFIHFQYIAPLRKRARWIVSVHDVLFLDLPQYFPLRYRLQNRVLFGISANRADIVLTVSEYSRDAISRHFGIPRQDIAITTNGLGSFSDIDPKPVAGLRPGRFFVYVSRFEPRKNQDGLIRALRRMSDELPPDCQLVLIGNAALPYPELDAELAAAGPLVRRLSNLSFAELVWLYRNAAAALYASFVEGFGIPPLEAVAAGGRSYAAANTAMNEISGYLDGTFDAGDTGDIQRVVREILETPDHTPDPTRRLRALEDFSWGHSADALLASIHRLDK